MGTGTRDALDLKGEALDHAVIGGLLNADAAPLGIVEEALAGRMNKLT